MTSPRYERFSRSHHWLPIGTEVPPAPPGAAFARACAGAVTRYWEIGLATGGVDPAREVVVLEPEAGSGQFTWQMLEALRESLAVSLCAGLQMRYVACTGDRTRAEALARHLASRGRESGLETAVWRAGREAPEADGVALDLSGNPLVILAHRYFGGLVQDLFRRRRGHLFEGLLAQRARNQPLAYRWRGIAAADWLPTAWRTLLEGDDASPPILFPSGALYRLDQLAQLAQRRYLLLAVDRDAADAPLPRSWPENRRLPVDFARLAAHQSKLGAQVWNGWRGEEGARALVILRDDANPARRETLAAVVASLREQAPDDHLHLAAILRAAAPALEPDRILALLRLSGFEPQVLEAGIERLIGAAPTWDEALREAWRNALSRVWALHLPHAGQGTLGPHLADLAMALGYWGLAKSVLRLEAALRSPPADCLFRLAQCELETGDEAAALAHAEQSLGLAATAACRDLRDRLLARRRTGDVLPWPRGELAPEGDLRLLSTRAGEWEVRHECWGLLATAVCRLEADAARFQLCWRSPQALPEDRAGTVRLLTRAARAAGATRCEVAMAGLGACRTLESSAANRPQRPIFRRFLAP
jgi:hypothetical protein